MCCNPGMRTTPTHLLHPLQLLNTWAIHTHYVHKQHNRYNLASNNKNYFRYIKNKSKVHSCYHFTVGSVQTACVTPPLRYYMQVNISEWCKGKKGGGGTFSSGFTIKWVLFPDLTLHSVPLPIFPYLYSCVHTSPINIPIRMFLILPTNVARLTPCWIHQPRERELNILCNK